MSKPIKLLEGIGNGGGNGALIRSTAILWTNDQHFIILRSVGVYGKGKPSQVEHMRIYISCPWRCAPLYRPVLRLACLIAVSCLWFNLCQCPPLSKAKTCNNFETVQDRMRVIIIRQKLVHGKSVLPIFGDLEWPWTAYWPLFCVITLNSPYF